MTTNHKREGTSLSGWCSAAPGARIPHLGCKYEFCCCDCHETRQEGGAR